MARWSDESIIFKVASGSLTNNYADNFITALDVRNGWIILYVDYVKGDEAYLDLQVYFDNSNRKQLKEEDENYENWFALSMDGYWPAEGYGGTDGVINSEITITEMPYRFVGSGKHRIVIPAFPREDAFKVAFKTDKASATGSVSIRYATDEIQWGMVGQGGE